MSWGDIPSWVAAVGTVGAFAVSLWLLYLTVADRAEERSYKRSEQARRIHIATPWAASASGEKFNWLNATYMVNLTNNSDEPIHDVMLRLDVTPAEHISVNYPTYNEQRRPSLAAGEFIEVVLTTRQQWLQGADEALQVTPLASATFTDGASITWTRGGDQRLHEIGLA